MLGTVALWIPFFVAIASCGPFVDGLCEDLCGPGTKCEYVSVEGTYGPVGVPTVGHYLRLCVCLRLGSLHPGHCGGEPGLLRLLRLLHRCADSCTSCALCKLLEDRAKLSDNST